MTRLALALQLNADERHLLGVIARLRSSRALLHAYWLLGEIRDLKDQLRYMETPR